MFGLLKLASRTICKPLERDVRTVSVAESQPGSIEIHPSQIIAAARWTKPVKWTVRRS